MNIYKLAKAKIKKILGLRNPVKYSRSLGVTVGNGVRFTGMPDYGSEPWLISIGDNVLITAEVRFITHDGSVKVLRNLDSKYKSVIKFGRIIVDDGAFIGVRSTIMPNVRIGKNAVVAACSCVTRDVPDNAIAAGVPARVIGTVQEAAEKWLNNTPVYDNDELQRDKIKVSKEIAEHYWSLKN